MLVSSSSSSSDSEGENMTKDSIGHECNVEKSKVEKEHLLNFHCEETINKFTLTPKTLTDYFKIGKQTSREDEPIQLHENTLSSLIPSSSTPLFNSNMRSSRSSVLHKTRNHNNRNVNSTRRYMCEVKEEELEEEEKEMREHQLQEEEEHRYTRECKRALHPSLVHQIALSYSYVSEQRQQQQRKSKVQTNNNNNITKSKRKNGIWPKENSTFLLSSTHSIPVQILHLSSDPFVPLPYVHQANNNSTSNNRRNGNITNREINCSTKRPLRRISLLLSSGAQLRLPLIPCDGIRSSSNNNNCKSKTPLHSSGNDVNKTQSSSYSHPLQSHKELLEEEEEEKSSSMFMYSSQSEAGRIVNDNSSHKIYWKVAPRINSVLHSQNQSLLHKEECNYNQDNNNTTSRNKIKVETKQESIECSNCVDDGGNVDMVDLFIGDLPSFECMCVNNARRLTSSLIEKNHPTLLTLQAATLTEALNTRNNKPHNKHQKEKSLYNKVEQHEEQEEWWKSQFTVNSSFEENETIMHIRFRTLPYKLIWLDCITFNSFRNRLVVSLPCEERIVTLYAPHHLITKTHKENYNNDCRKDIKIYKNNNQSRRNRSLNQVEEHSSSLESMEQEFPDVVEANHVNCNIPSSESNNYEQGSLEMSRTENTTQIADIEVVSSFPLHRGTIPLDVVQIPHLPFIAIGTYEHGVLIIKLDLCTASLLYTVRTLDLSGIKAGLYPITALAAIAPRPDRFSNTGRDENKSNTTVKPNFNWESDAHDLLSLSHVSLLCSSILESCVTMIKCASDAHGVIEDFPSITNWTETITCVASHVNTRPAHNKYLHNERYSNCNNNDDIHFMERKRERPSMWESEQQKRYSSIHYYQKEEEEEEEEEEEVGVLIALGDRHLLRYTAHCATMQQHHSNKQGKPHERQNNRKDRNVENNSNNNNTKRIVADAATQLSVHRQTMWWCGTGMITAMAPGPLIYQQAHPSSNYSRVFAYPRHWLICVDINNTIYLLDRAATVYSTHSSLTLQACVADNTIKEQDCTSANEKNNSVDRTRCIDIRNGQNRSSSKTSEKNKTNVKENTSHTSTTGSSKSVKTKRGNVMPITTNTNSNNANTRSNKTDNSEVTKVDQVTSGVVTLAAGDGWLCACVAHHQNCLSVIYWGV